MPKKLSKILKMLGPGVVTGASDDDPAGIATYSQAGAQFGLATLWMAFLTLPLMISVQEMSARIGFVTSQGLMANIEKHYPRYLTYFILLLIFPATILNIGADISAMGAVAHMLCHFVPSFVFSFMFTFGIIFLMIHWRYQKIANVLKYLCLSLLLYVIVPFLIHTNTLDIIKHTFIPVIQLNKQFFAMVVAILGTTISPYLFFWQATMEAEQQRQKVRTIGKKAIKNIRYDVTIGMFFSNIVMYFIILTTGMVIFHHGSSDIHTVEEAAKALEPLAGSLCYLLFSIGIIGTGLLAIPVLGGTLAYLYSASFHHNGGLDNKFHEAKAFYTILTVSLVLGLLFNILNFNPITALVYSAILYGILSPPIILIIMLIANNKKIMGNYVNGFWSNTIGIITLIFMTACVVSYLVVGSA